GVGYVSAEVCTATLLVVYGVAGQYGQAVRHRHHNGRRDRFHASLQHAGEGRAARPVQALDVARLEGRVAIVTGAGSGNGLAIAAAFAREGANVVVAEYYEDRGSAAVASINAAGGENAVLIRTDVRSWTDVD